MWRFIAGRLLVHWRWSHLKITPALVDVWQDSETSHSRSSLGNFQHWYLADMLAGVYSRGVPIIGSTDISATDRVIFTTSVIGTTITQPADIKTPIIAHAKFILFNARQKNVTIIFLWISFEMPQLFLVHCILTTATLTLMELHLQLHLHFLSVKIVAEIYGGILN